jgi:hypothetical protein
MLDFNNTQRDTGLEIFKRKAQEFGPTTLLTDNELTNHYQNRFKEGKFNPNNREDVETLASLKLAQKMKETNLSAARIFENSDNPVAYMDSNDSIKIEAPASSFSEKNRYYKAKNATYELAKLDSSEQGFIDFFKRAEMNRQYSNKLTPEEANKLARDEGIDIKWDKPVIEGEVRFAIERNKLRQMLQSELSVISNDSLSGWQNLGLIGAGMAGSMPASELALTCGLSWFMPHMIVASAAKYGLGGIKIQEAARAALAANRAQKASNRYMNELKLVQDLINQPGKGKEAIEKAKKVKKAFQQDVMKLLRDSGFDEETIAKAGGSSKAAKNCLEMIENMQKTIAKNGGSERFAYNLVSILKGTEQLEGAGQLGLGTHMLLNSADNVVTSVPFLASSYLNSNRNKTDSYGYKELMIEGLIAGAIGAVLPLAGKGLVASGGAIKDLYRAIDDKVRNNKHQKLLTGHADEISQEVAEVKEVREAAATTVPKSVQQAAQDLQDAPINDTEAATIFSYIADCIAKGDAGAIGLRLSELVKQGIIRTPVLTHLNHAARTAIQTIEKVADTDIETLNQLFKTTLYDVKFPDSTLMKNVSANIIGETGLLGRQSIKGLSDDDAISMLTDIYKFNIFKDEEAFVRAEAKLNAYADGVERLQSYVSYINKHVGSLEGYNGAIYRNELQDIIGRIMYGQEWDNAINSLKAEGYNKKDLLDLLRTPEKVTQEDIKLMVTAINNKLKASGFTEDLFNKREGKQALAEKFEKLATELQDILDNNSEILDTDNIINQQYKDPNALLDAVVNNSMDETGTLRELLDLPDILPEEFRAKANDINEKRNIRDGFATDYAKAQQELADADKLGDFDEAVAVANVQAKLKNDQKADSIVYTNNDRLIANIGKALTTVLPNARSNIIKTIMHNSNTRNLLADAFSSSNKKEAAIDILWGSKSPIREAFEKEIASEIKKVTGIEILDSHMLNALDDTMSDLIEKWIPNIEEIIKTTGNEGFSDVSKRANTSMKAALSNATEAADNVKSKVQTREDLQTRLETEKQIPMSMQSKKAETGTRKSKLPPKRLEKLKEHDSKVYNKYEKLRNQVRNKKIGLAAFEKEVKELFQSKLETEWSEDVYDDFLDTLERDKVLLQDALGKEADAKTSAEIDKLNQDIESVTAESDKYTQDLAREMEKEQRFTALFDAMLDPLFNALEDELLSRQIDAYAQNAAVMRNISLALDHPNYASEVFASVFTQTPYEIKGAGNNIEKLMNAHLGVFAAIDNNLRLKAKGTTTAEKMTNGGVDYVEYLHNKSNLPSINKALALLREYKGDIDAIKKSGASLNDSDYIVANEIYENLIKFVERNRKHGSRKTKIGNIFDHKKLRNLAYRLEESDIAGVKNSLDKFRSFVNNIEDKNKKNALSELVKQLDILDKDNPIYETRLGYHAFEKFDLDRMFPSHGKPKTSMNSVRDMIISGDYDKLLEMNSFELNDINNTLAHTMDSLMGTSGTKKASGWVRKTMVGSKHGSSEGKGTYVRYMEEAQDSVIYKDVDTEIEALNMFGYDTIEEQLQAMFGGLQREYAVISRVGSNPMGVLESMLSIHDALISNKLTRGDFADSAAKEHASISDAKKKWLRSCALLACGLDDTPASIGTRILKIVQDFAVAPALVNAGLKSVTDYQYAHQYMIDNGLRSSSDMLGWTKGLAMTKKFLLDNPDLRALGQYNVAITKDKYLNFVTNGEASAYIRGLASDAPNMIKWEERARKWSDLWINQIARIERLTNLHRTSAYLNVMHSLAADEFNISFDDFVTKFGNNRGGRLQALLQRHDIDKESWDFLRNNCRRSVKDHMTELSGDANNHASSELVLFFPEVIARMSDEQIEEEMLRRGIADISPRDIERFRDVEYEKASLLIQASADEMTSLPTARTTAGLSLTFSHNSGMGAALNSLLKFKSFGAAVNQIHHGRRIARYIDTTDENCYAGLMGRLFGVGTPGGFLQRETLGMYRDLAGFTTWIGLAELSVNLALDPLKGTTQGFTNDKGEFNVNKIKDPIIGSMGIMADPLDMALGFFEKGGTRGGGIAIKAGPIVSRVFNPVKQTLDAFNSGTTFGEKIQKGMFGATRAAGGFIGLDKAAFIAPIYNEMIGNYLERMTLGNKTYFKNLHRKEREGYTMDWWGQRGGYDTDPFFGLFD